MAKAQTFDNFLVFTIIWYYADCKENCEKVSGKMIDLETLKWRLAETNQWCNLRLNPEDPEKSLRSPELDFKVQPYDEKGYYILWRLIGKKQLKI